MNIYATIYCRASRPATRQQTFFTTFSGGVHAFLKWSVQAKCCNWLQNGHTRPHKQTQEQSLHMKCQCSSVDSFLFHNSIPVDTRNQALAPCGTRASLPIAYFYKRPAFFPLPLSFSHHSSSPASHTLFTSELLHLSLHTSSSGRSSSQDTVLCLAQTDLR